MKRIAIALSAVVLANCAMTAEPSAPRSPKVEIPFANLGGIYNWQADGDKGIYIEGRNRKWYYATLMEPCLDLPWTERVGFVTHPIGNFDKFSSILVEHRECHVQSLANSAPPPKKDKAS